MRETQTQRKRKHARRKSAHASVVTRESPGELSALEEEILEGEQEVGERAGESREVRQGEGTRSEPGTAA